MNALNVRKVNAYVNSRNQDFSLIGLGMRLPLAMMTMTSKWLTDITRNIGYLVILEFGPKLHMCNKHRWMWWWCHSSILPHHTIAM